jgi:hypothetical protein
MKTFLLLLCVTTGTAFRPALHPISLHPPKPLTTLQLTTEEDVIQLVEKAEQLWSEAYTARQYANDLSAEAETLGISAEQTTSLATDSLQSSVSISKIGDAQHAQNLSLDLGALLKKVEEAERKAIEIEKKADEALKESEVAFERHLIDFPENA